MVRNQWNIRIRGTQREEIDVQLLTNVVIMLARQLGRETTAIEPLPQDVDDRDETEDACSSPS
jgi:hypothetical protein